MNNIDRKTITMKLSFMEAWEVWAALEGQLEDPRYKKEWKPLRPRYRRLADRFKALMQNDVAR